MAQQTALEWLAKEFCKNGIDIGSGYKAAYEIPKQLLEQAKEMEKDQICEAWQHGKQQTFLGLGKVLTSEEYYNETYNK
jgi:hypothetical protein